MSGRELVVLGTSSQTPTRYRNHNGYLVRFDDQLLLVDPGEGTQRQATLASQALARLTAIAVTHFHGDHCLGLPGVIQRLNADSVEREIPVFHPAAGSHFLERLRYASEYHEKTPIVAVPIDADGAVARLGGLELQARRLDHRTTTFGYRLQEPDRRRFVTEALTAVGIEGRAVGELQRTGVAVGADGTTVGLADVTETRPGQAVAVIMDTRMCDGALALITAADLAVVESTFLHTDADLAARYGHLTARQAGELAAEGGARLLVLTHFSQRYLDAQAFVDEAASVFTGPVVAAADLDRIKVPPR